jgi:N-acetylglucosamine kinase-like BadF-type ATPase
MLIVCVDAGQTKTSVVVFNENKRELDQWTDEPIIHYARVAGLDSYFNIAVNLCGKLNKMSIRQPVSICFSLSGYHGDVTDIPIIMENGLKDRCFDLARLDIVPDYLGNWYAVTEGDSGIVIISGGGTVAYGKSRDGRSIRIGGWGHLLGDEGSGYWIGLESVKAVLKSQAGIAEKTDLEKSIFEALNISGERELLASINSGKVTDKALALLSPIVNEQAEKGDVVAYRILDSAADHLNQLVLTASRKLDHEVPIYLSGGVFKAAVLMECLIRKLEKSGCNQLIVYKDAKPAEGIYRIARYGR